MTDDLSSGRLTTSTAISLSLVVTLLIGTVLFGRYLQKIDQLERDTHANRVAWTQDIQELRVEVRQVREILLRGYQPAPSSRN